MSLFPLKPILLRLHRWTTLVFAVPLALVILTGLVLSFEPLVQAHGISRMSLPATKVLEILDEHDKDGKTRAITVRSYENRLILQGVGEDGETEIDLTTGDEAEDAAGWTLSEIFRTARGLHEHFIFDLEWVVIASTIAMLVLIGLGLLMGWPRLRHSFSGWHQGMAWFGLPILILSPVTGLMLAYGVTFTNPQPQDRGATPSIREAVEMLAKDKPELGGLIWLRPRGGRLLARISEQGSFNVYQITRGGVRLTPTNWPRGLHEGNVGGLWSGVMVLVTSFAFVGLMVTGLTIWVRRTFRRRNRARPLQAAAE